MSRKRLISNTSIVFGKGQRVPSKRYKENFDRIRWDNLKHQKPTSICKNENIDAEKSGFLANNIPNQEYSEPKPEVTPKDVSSIDENIRWNIQDPEEFTGCLPKSKGNRPFIFNPDGSITELTGES